MNDEIAPQENLESALEIKKLLNPNLIVAEAQKKPESKLEEETSPKEEDKKAEALLPSEETKEEEKASSEEGQKQNFEELYTKILKESEVKQKRAEDNQRHARQLERNIAGIKQHIENLVTEGLDEEMAQSILDVASKNVDPEKLFTSDSKGTKEKLPEHIEGITSLISQASEVLEKYLELSPHEGEEKKLAEGFNLHLNLLSDEGKKELYDHLKKQKDSPKALLKSMLEIGDEFWGTSLGKGFAEHGSMIGIIDAQTKTIDSLTEQLQKLGKKEKKTQENEKTLTEKTVADAPNVSSISDPASRMRNAWKRQGLSDDTIDIMMKSA